MRHRFFVLLAVFTAALVLAIFAPLHFLIRTALRDVDDRIPVQRGFTDDASRLNQTPVAEIWDLPVDAANPEQQIAELLAKAADEGLRVSIAGARRDSYRSRITSFMASPSRANANSKADTKKPGTRSRCG